MKIKGFLDSEKCYLSNNANFWSWLMNKSWPWKSKSYAGELMPRNFGRAGSCLLLTRGIPRFTVPLNIALFTNWRFVVILHPAISTIFFQQHLLTLCYILVIFAIFQTFSFLWWSVISDFDVIVAIALSDNELKCCVCSTYWPFSHLSPLLRPP